jgi:hypothetical protein
VDPIAVTAGLVQTGLYLDFFYVYFTKWVLYVAPAYICFLLISIAESSTARNSNFRHELTYFGLSESDMSLIRALPITNRSWTFMHALETIEF